MKRAYRIISNHPEDMTIKGIENLTDEEREAYLGFGDDEDITIFRFDGERCHWSEGEAVLAIAFADEEKIALMKRLDEKIHPGESLATYTKFEDITSEVLHSAHDTSIYGFMEEHVQRDFHLYRERYLEKDDILDKINIYGIDSLTENDRLFMQDRDMVDPFYNT
jgi:hypothetical protein